MQIFGIRKKEFVLSKEILRSGVNIEKAIGGSSEKDFLAKITISYKEVRETIYWIKLLKATDYLNQELSVSLLNDAEEICRIIGKFNSQLKIVIRNY